MKDGNVVYNKGKAFAIRIVRLKQWICKETKEYSLADQILRSGTSIGANISEAVDAVSDRDFINKLNISLKECSETKFWLDILMETNLINRAIYESMMEDCNELYALLTSIIKTMNNKLKHK
ncbi:MAG: four helix bundle protein [Muribaculaceae bacterium]|nr:four helix bundle protein [Muribaculaceae bacterium]